MDTLSELLLFVRATILVFGLFYRVNKSLPIIIALLNLCAIGIEAANRFNLIDVIVLLKGGDAGDSGAIVAVAGQVSAYLQFYSYGFAFSLFIFSFVCTVIGYLIIQSLLVPRPIGFLMIVAGLCYLTITTTLIGLPRLEQFVFPYVFLLILLAEMSFASWLLLKGVDAEKWAGGGPVTSAGPARAAKGEAK